jgi:hypothetical protein
MQNMSATPAKGVKKTHHRPQTVEATMALLTAITNVSTENVQRLWEWAAGNARYEDRKWPVQRRIQNLGSEIFFKEYQLSSAEERG